MPYPRVEPVPESEMGWGTTKGLRFKGYHTICQILREIYFMTDNEELKLNCRTALAMAKRMDRKLKWYKSKELEKTV